MDLSGVPAWWLAVHFAVAAAGTWFARRYALRRALIDHPGERRSHVSPTPRGGGLGIAVALLLALAWLAWMLPAQRVPLLSAAAGLVLVAGVGWADDHRPLPASLRLLVHALAALLLAGAMLWHGASGWMALAAALLALVLVNVWNFMDGIDGLAASQAALAASGYLLLGGGGAGGWLAAALLVVALGFLPFNFPRARVFLGDVGSCALGFGLACTCMLLLLQPGTPGLPWLLLPLLAFLLDSGFTLLSRILNRQKWWQAHSQHAYQHWARRSGHPAVVLGYGAWTLLAVAAMLGFRQAGLAIAFALLCAGTATAWIAWKLLRGEHR